MSFDSTKTNAASPPKKGGIVRYLFPLALLVIVIGGVAWIAQHLDKWGSARPHNPQQVSTKAPLEFAAKIAQWGPKHDPTDTKVEPRDVEPNQKGHFDFPFKNNTSDEVEIIAFGSSCDCTSVLACGLDEAETKRAY